MIAWGHPNVSARHRTTFEITRDENLTVRGDCIIGVRANKSVYELDERIKEWLRSGKPVIIEVELPQYGLKERVKAYGSDKLTFKNRRDIVVRKSSFTCDRTLAIRSDKSASDFDREMIELLRDPRTELRFTIRKYF